MNTGSMATAAPGSALAKRTVRVAVAIGGYPGPERQRRIDAVRAFQSPDTEVGVVEVPATPYVKNLTPAHMQEAAPAFISAFRDAERQGYDAVLPLGTLDLGVEGGRSAVNIPVIGPCQSMLQLAAQIGDRFGVISYHDGQIPLFRAMIRRYGMENWVAGFATTGFRLVEMASNSQAVGELFLECARKLVREQGADVVIAMGISQCPLIVGAQAASEHAGVPVLEGIGTPIHVAASMARLGLTQSPVRWPRAAEVG